MQLSRHTAPTLGHDGRSLPYALRHTSGCPNNARHAKSPGPPDGPGLRLRPRGVHLGTALTDSGVEDARKRARSACRSTWSLWSRCCCLCNCLDPFRLERTLVRLASLFTPLGLASIATCVAWLLGWF